MKPLPEDMNPAAIDAAKQALEALPLDQLQELADRLLKEVNQLPQRLSLLSADAERYAVDVKNSVLLGTLTGANQNDLKRLELLAEEVATQRRQARTDLSRATKSLDLVHREIQRRSEYDQYQAILKATPGLKADFGAA